MGRKSGEGAWTGVEARQAILMLLLGVLREVTGDLMSAVKSLHCKAFDSCLAGDITLSLSFLVFRVLPVMAV